VFVNVFVYKSVLTHYTVVDTFICWWQTEPLVLFALYLRKLKFVNWKFVTRSHLLEVINHVLPFFLMTVMNSVGHNSFLIENQ
jgi:hypothetical protein